MSETPTTQNDERRNTLQVEQYTNSAEYFAVASEQSISAAEKQEFSLGYDQMVRPAVWDAMDSELPERTLSPLEMLYMTASKEELAYRTALIGTNIDHLRGDYTLAA